MITTKTKAAAALDAILTAINNTGTDTPGSLVLRTGSAPTLVTDAATGTLLATCVLVDGTQAAFGNTNTTTLVATGYVSGGKFAEDTGAAATGTAGYFRILDSAGTARLQGSVGTSGADLNLNTLSIVAGADVLIASFTITISGLS